MNEITELSIQSISFYFFFNILTHFTTDGIAAAAVDNFPSSFQSCCRHSWAFAVVAADAVEAHWSDSCWAVAAGWRESYCYETDTRSCLAGWTGASSSWSLEAVASSDSGQRYGHTCSCCCCSWFDRACRRTETPATSAAAAGGWSSAGIESSGRLVASWTDRAGLARWTV